MRFSLQEALEMVYTDNYLDIKAIYIEPPEVDGRRFRGRGNDGDLDKLSGRQFRAPVDVRLQHNDENPIPFKEHTEGKETKLLWTSGDLHS